MKLSVFVLLLSIFKATSEGEDGTGTDNPTTGTEEGEDGTGTDNPTTGTEEGEDGTGTDNPTTGTEEGENGTTEEGENEVAATPIALTFTVSKPRPVIFLPADDL